MNMRKAIYTLLLLPLMALTGCVNDGLEPCPSDPSDTPAGYLELTVTTGGTTASRANPTGGEEGDGPEHGRNNENTIHTLTIFVYADKDGLGLDSDENEIVWSKYVDAATIEDSTPDFPLDHIYNVRIPLADTDFQYFRPAQGTTLRAAFVANAGDLSRRFNNVYDLRGADFGDIGDAWKQPADGSAVDKSDYFVMSSAFNAAKRNDGYANDGVVNVATNNTDGIVYSCEATLERVAARIDLEFSDAQIYNPVDGTLVYTIAGTSADAPRKVTILNSIPVNLMQTRSYIFKHLTQGVNLDRTDFLVAADETDNNGIPTNYVVSPNFFQKLLATNNEDDFTRWFLESRASWLRSPNNRNSLESRYEMNSFGEPFDIKSDWTTTTGNRAITITYSNENTQSMTEHDSRYITGLLFRAQYNPGKVYDINQQPVDYTPGADLYLFRTVADEVLEANNLYFATADARSAYIATLPAGGKYETADYPGGICYYNIWIKHANTYTPADGNYDEDIPMKYGIVRNNIYRISLSFNGIGQPTPEITEPYNITSRIYVIKWNFRPQPEIIM